MNDRQRYELKILSEDGRLDMTKIADTFSVNLRTIRYDIQMLNEYLNEKTGQECIGVNNKIAYIENMQHTELQKYVETSVKDFYVDRLTNEERILMIVFDLCWNNRYSTIQEIADKYYVSRATVNKDIVAVKEYCRQNKIHFVSNRGKGLYIEADEMERRRYLARVIRDFTTLQEKDNRHATSGYSQWFADKEMSLIKAIVKEVEIEFSTYLADIAYEALVLHIALSLERFRTKSEYGELNEKALYKKDSVQYKMAYEIIRRINETFSVELPDTEIHYVAMHIGSKSSNVIKHETTGDVLLEYYCVRLIASVSEYLPYNLNHDERLYESLLQHLNVCAYRKKSGMLLENPLKDELIHTYPQLYKIIRQVLETEVNQDVIVLNDDEITYILLHFVTALYIREQNANRLMDVVVVCATGVGTAELVVAGLNKHFHMNIKGTVGVHQLEEFLKHQDVDMIISTVPLKITKCHVLVNPLLKRGDIVRIGKQILDMGFDIEKPMQINDEWSDTAKNVHYLLLKYAEREQEELLREKLNLCLKYKKTEKNEERYMLSELVNERTIRLDVAAEDWQDSIRKSGELLIKTGDITEEYVDAVIDNVNEVGPYIVITKGVALPHATNKAGVYHTAMSFVRLQTPIKFGNKANDPVEYIFMLATVDSKSHMGALQDLAELLDDKEFMAVLKAAKEPADIISYIKANESSR